MIHSREDYQQIQDPSNRIPNDEPVFLLRAQDETASKTLRYWADLQKDDTVAALARKHADLMDEWPVKKSADL